MFQPGATVSVICSLYHVCHLLVALWTLWALTWTGPSSTIALWVFQPPFSYLNVSSRLFIISPMDFLSPQRNLQCLFCLVLLLNLFFVPCTAGCELGGQMTKRRCHTEPPIISRCGRLKWYSQQAQMVWGGTNWKMEWWMGHWNTKMPILFSIIASCNVVLLVT